MQGFEAGELVTVAEGFLGNKTELNLKGKLCIAVVLSYAMLDFRWQPWFPHGWTRSGIKLVQNRDRLFLRPVLVTSMRPNTTTRQPPEASTELKMLLHGVLLIEIFRQDQLPFQFQVGESIHIQQLRNDVRAQFEMIEWDVCERLRQAVEACINGDPGSGLEPEEPSEDSFAAIFYRRVIGPIEEDFNLLWGNREPDQVLSELTLPRVERKKPPIPASKPTHLRVCGERYSLNQ